MTHCGFKELYQINLYAKLSTQLVMMWDSLDITWIYVCELVKVGLLSLVLQRQLIIP